MLQNEAIQYSRGVCGLTMSKFVIKNTPLYKAYMAGKKDSKFFNKEDIITGKLLSNRKRVLFLATVKNLKDE